MPKTRAARRTLRNHAHLKLSASLPIALFAVSLSQLCCPTAARAQGDENPRPPSQRPPGASAAPGTAAIDRLSKASWRVEARGPLILVAPEAMSPAAFAQLPPPPRNGDNLAELAPRIHRQLVHTGGVWTLAPTKLPVITPPKMPDEMVRDGNQAIIALIGALGAGSSQLGSADGISRVQLRDEASRKLFDRIVPPMVTVPVRHLPPDLQARKPDEENPPMLPAAALANVRLRARWIVDIELRGGTDDDTEVIDTEDESDDPELPFLTRPADEPSMLNSVPGRSKPGELPFSWEGLNAMVPIDGVRTVDDLVDRVARTANLRLIADARVGKYSVIVRGASARAGDVLEALCRALGGAIRRLGPDNSGSSLFILAEDVVPLGTRTQAALQSLIGDMLGQLGQMRASTASVARVRQRLRERGWEALPFARPAGIADGSLVSAFQARSAQLTMAELSPALAKRVRETWDEHRKSRESNETPSPVNPTMKAEPRLRIEAVIPGLDSVTMIAELPLEELFGPEKEPDTMAPITLPGNVRLRTLMARLPSGDDQIHALVDAARAAAFTEIAVPLSGDPKDDAQIAPLAAAAKAAGLGLVPILTPQSASPDAPADAREVDALGQSLAQFAGSTSAKRMVSILPEMMPMMDWARSVDPLMPERVDVAAVTARLAALSAIPGVTEVGLDAVRSTFSADDNDGEAPFFVLWNSGVNPGERRQFAERHRIDPADISDELMGLMGFIVRKGVNDEDLSPALLAMSDPGAGGATAAWGQRRIERRRLFAQRLGAAIAGVKLSAPLRVMAAPRIAEEGRWERFRGAPSLAPGVKQSGDDEAKPEVTPLDAHPIRLHLSVAGRTLTRIDENSDDSATKVVEWLSSVFKRWSPPASDSAGNGVAVDNSAGVGNGAPPDGFVLDLSDRSVENTVAFVQKWLRAPGVVAH